MRGRILSLYPPAQMTADSGKQSGKQHPMGWTLEYYFPLGFHSSITNPLVCQNNDTTLKQSPPKNLNLIQLHLSKKIPKKKKKRISYVHEFKELSVLRIIGIVIKLINDVKNRHWIFSISEKAFFFHW